jgi:sugar-specific transcriptional regulator TrmB
LTSLLIGPSSLLVLARTAGIDRGTAYHVAMTLEQKGLFETVQEGKRPQFRVTHPRCLFEYVEKKKQEADRHFDAMQEMIGDLEELYDLGVNY